MSVGDEQLGSPRPQAHTLLELVSREPEREAIAKDLLIRAMDFEVELVIDEML